MKLNNVEVHHKVELSFVVCVIPCERDIWNCKMSHTILKIGNLDLDLQGPIASNFQNFYFNCQTLNRFEFAFQLELFIKHLNVSNGLKTDDLDLDLQGQSGLDT